MYTVKPHKVRGTGRARLVLQVFLMISALVPDSGSWPDGSKIKRAEQQLVPPARPREGISHLWLSLGFILPRTGLFLTQYEGLHRTDYKALQPRKENDFFWILGF